MIPEGKKPNMYDKSFVEADSWRGAIYRFIKGENRKEMMMEINNLIDQFASAIENYQETEFKNLILKTLVAMENGGLTNLLRTYHDIGAPDIVASLQVSIDTVKLLLKKYKFD
jgi:hypothetical protein